MPIEAVDLLYCRYCYICYIMFPHWLYSLLGLFDKLTVCGTVSSIMSGLETRSLGRNLQPRHSLSKSVVRPPLLGLTSTKQRVNVTCSGPQRNVHRRGIEPGTSWSEIRCPIHCATPPPYKLTYLIFLHSR